MPPFCIGCIFRCCFVVPLFCWCSSDPLFYGIPSDPLVFRRSVDEGGQAGSLLTDLSKAFDCIDQELLITKLYVYCFDKKFFVFHLIRILGDGHREPR